jgi:hypothetical protein
MHAPQCRVNRYFAPSNSVEVHHSDIIDQPLRRYISKELVLAPKNMLSPPLSMFPPPRSSENFDASWSGRFERRWSRRRFITTDREEFTYDRLTEALWLTPECLKMQAWPLLERHIILPQRITSEAPRSPANDPQRRR